MNRYEKVDHDVAEWLPAQNHCWFAAWVSAVRQRCGLSIKRREADALDRVLAECTTTDLVVFGRGLMPSAAAPVAVDSDVVAAWDDNRNDHISCAEARGHSIAPVTHDHPAYLFMRDGVGDGMVCESGSGCRLPTRASPADGGGCDPYPSCTALRRDHPGGVSRGHCAYQRLIDRDNDGRAREG